MKDALPKRGEYEHRLEGNRLVLSYRREQFRRETWIETDATATFTANAIHFHAHIPAHGDWTTTLQVITAVVGMTGPYTEVRSWSSKENRQRDLQTWVAAAPTPHQMPRCRNTVGRHSSLSVPMQCIPSLCSFFLGWIQR